MAGRATADPDLIEELKHNYLFREVEPDWLTRHLATDRLTVEKLYSNRPVYTAFRPNTWLEGLYIILSGGPVILCSTPLDRIIAISYAGSCFGMRSLPLGYGQSAQAFPSRVEAYKTTDVVKIPLKTVQQMYQEEPFRQRYDRLFELREKFQYHLLNCSTYPPQAVAALLRAILYQERELGNQPQPDGAYVFDLAIDLIARTSQLNHRTVEQVLKGMQKVGILAPPQPNDSDDVIRIVDPEALKETYSATRDKVPWWPLKA